MILNEQQIVQTPWRERFDNAEQLVERLQVERYNRPDIALTYTTCRLEFRGTWQR